MTHSWLRFLVPRNWTAGQALAAVTLCQQAIDAVWAVHGEDMAATLGELGPESPTWHDILREDRLDFEDDIPF